ncbi:MAG: hypothetical protein KAX65_09115 [Caldilineaceae bacterium]|nr:hypothetical protein [Caldilineaceae bacterium]
MSVPHKKTQLKPDDPTPDPTDPPATPMNPIDQAEEMVSLFMRGAWFLKRSAAGSAADNRAALEAGIRIAELRQAKAQHVEAMAVFSRIAAALEGKTL